MIEVCYKLGSLKYYFDELKAKPKILLFVIKFWQIISDNDLAFFDYFQSIKAINLTFQENSKYTVAII